MPIHVTLVDPTPDPSLAGDPAPADAAPADAAPNDALPDPALSDQQRRFVLEYIIDFNGTAAASRAGYTRRCAAQWAAHALRRPDIQAAIRRELKAREGRTRVTGDRIIAELARIAFADPSRIARWSGQGVILRHSDDLTADDLAAVKRISIGESKGRGTRRAQHFEMHDKIGALAMLARLTGLLNAPRGRFGLQQETGDQRARQDANAILRERLLRIARGNAPGTVAPKAADAAGVGAQVSADE